MEGDGEGLVAIVQGLDPAGVTLTVCNRSRLNLDRRRSSRTRIQINAANARPRLPAADRRSHTSTADAATLACQRSPVQTSTDADFSRQNTSSQICDGRYASSYKLAHCMLTPTSPPEAVSEFPPQRREPCRNEGNFEIGGHGSGQWNCRGSGQGSCHSSGRVRVSASRVRHYGGSQTWLEKGSSQSYCKSNRETEAFAHSLRKYPNMAPFRTASTDIIEKLIRYTQAKNFQEMSHSTKSMRSLRQQKSLDTYAIAKASKHQQTYTRTQDVNVVNNSNYQVGYRGKPRNFKLYSPMSDTRNLKESQRETKCSSSYDYLKAGNSPYRRSNRSDESPSPLGSSPERTRSPEKSRSPDGCKSPEIARSPVRFKSTNGFKSPDGPNRPDRPIRFERSDRDLSLRDMSKYIRSTIRQMCNERPVVFQVCPKLKNRFNQHKKVCPNKNERSSDVIENELEEEQASSSVLSRLIKSFSGCAVPPTEQAGCQCTRINCYCTKATQCVNNPDASTNTTPCSCKNPTKTGCCRGMPCICPHKAQEQAYYNKRIDEEISEWLNEILVHSIEGLDSKKKTETVIEEFKKILKQLPDDENFDDNARNEIKSFVDDFSLWNPGKDKTDEKLFKNQLASKLAEKIISVPRKPDIFRDIVKKWVVDMNFEDDGENLDQEIIIDKFVDKLKCLAAVRPACDVKYTHTLRKVIIELLVELALKFYGDMIMLKKMANKLAREIVSIPRNVNLTGDTTDLTDDFEENVSDWICEHSLCEELKKDPRFIEGLAKKLNKLKSQGIYEECVVEKMKEEIYQFVDDVGIAIETMDELIDELMKQLSNTVQTNEMERLDQDELTEIFIDWLRHLPGTSDSEPRTFEKIIKELVEVIIEGREQGNKDLKNDIFNYLVDADLSIDPAELAIYIEELIEKLNILPSNKFRKKVVKNAMIKDIFDIIQNMSMPQDKKAELRNKAHQIVENHLNRSSLNSKEAHDDVKEAIMDDMDDVISSTDIPKKSQLKLKTSLGSMLNSHLDKTFMRLSRDGSNLKQTIAKGVRNAVKELPINMDKKKDLMQHVMGTLSKNVHRPLPNNVKSTINDEISVLVEICPISEDNSVVGSIKKMLSAVSSKHLNICLPKCVCDIQSKLEKDIGIVIDKSSIDTGKKKELKKSIQDILTENEDRYLTDKVLRTIKKDINGVVSDLSIPQDKKDVLKKTVGETICKEFNGALSNLRHDLNRIRNKLFEDICNIIEKSPISRVVKSHLLNKLKYMLARNLDTSLSNEKKYTILDEVSNKVKDDMPEEKRRSSTNKLTKNFDTQHKKEDTNEIDHLTDNLKELENKILENILRKIEQAIDETPNTRERKIKLKKKLKNMATIDYKKPAVNIAEVLKDGMNDIIDELNFPNDKKFEIISELAAAIDGYSKLLRGKKDEETEYLQMNRRLSADANGKQKKIGKDLMPNQKFDENKAIESILQGIDEIIEQSAIAEDKKIGLKRNLKKMAIDNLIEPFSDEVQDAIKNGIADILEELQIPKSDKYKLKRTLINMTNDNFREAKQAVEKVDEIKAKENILQGVEKIIEQPAPELKKKIKKMATDNLKKPFSDDMQDAIKISIADILEELQIPRSEKDILKRALINMLDKNLGNLRELKQPVVKSQETKPSERILQVIEEIIEQSVIPEDKNMELKMKLKKISSDNLKKPFSNGVQDAIKIGIADIIEELQIPKSEEDKMKRVLINTADKNLTNLRQTKTVRPSKGLVPIKEINETNANESFLQEIEKFIEESAIPEEKKMELKQKFKKMASDNLKNPFSEDVQDALKIGIADILDELQIQESEKNKLKRALINMADENLDNLREIELVRPLKGQMPVEKFDKTKIKERILQGIEKNIEESAISEEKKIVLKRKLKENTADNLRKPFTDDVHDAIKIGMADILDELQIPNSEKNYLKRALINMVDENIDKLRGIPPKLSSQVDHFKELESETQNNILFGFEKVIDEAPVPIENKKDFKKKIKHMATKHLQKSLSDDIGVALRDGIYEVLDELNLQKDKKNKLKSELTAAVDDYLSNFKNQINFTKSMPDAKRNKPQFDEAVDPIYQKQLDEEFYELLEIALMDGDFKDARMKLIKKLMRDQNLSEKEASAPVDVLIGRAREMALKEDMGDEIYKLDPCYVKTLEADIDELSNIALVDEDFEDARRKLTNKLIREQNLPEEEAIDFADKLIGKVQKMALSAKSKDKSLLHIESSAELISDVVDQFNISKPDKNSFKKKLLSNLKEVMDKKSFINKEDLEPLKSEILKYLKKIVDVSSIPVNKKDELKSILNDELAKTIDKMIDDYDDEEEYTKTYTKAISKAVDKSPITNREKRSLKKELAKFFDGIIDDYDEGKITEHKEAFSKSINDVDQSDLSKPDKRSLKNKLLNKVKQTVDESPHINDKGALKAQDLKDCNNLVDTSSISIGKKNEWKSLLKEEMMDDYDDEETFAIEESQYKSPIPLEGIMDHYGEITIEAKLKKYKEAFVRAINDAVDQSTLSKFDKSSQKNKLLSKLNQTIDNSPHLDDISGEVLKYSKIVVDVSSIPIDKKNELKLLLQEAMLESSKELMDDEEVLQQSLDEIMDDEIAMAAKLKKYKDAFARAINDAVDQSRLSKPDKNSQKNKLLSKVNQTIDISSHLNDIPIAEVLKDSTKVVDVSSISIDKKDELKLLLQEAMAETSKELMDDEKVSREPLDEIMNDYDENLAEAKLKKHKNAFATVINDAVDQSTLSNRDKNRQKIKFFTKVNQTVDNSPHLNDIGALKAEVLKDSKKIVDISSNPIDNKNELKLLLEEAMAKKSKELLDDEEVSREAFAINKNKTTETVKSWMDSLPIDLNPKVAAAVAKDLASDILDRQKYLQVHPEAVSTDKDEIKNLKYQIFRRMNNAMETKHIPPIMERTEDLYRMIIEIEPPLVLPKLRDQSSCERRRRDPVLQDKKNNTSSALSTRNNNYSFKELVATSKSVKRQWSRDLDEAITQLPLPRNETCFLKENLAIYDETGLINMLSTKSRAKKEASTIEGTKSNKHVTSKPADAAPKPAQKNNIGKPSSHLSKTHKVLTFNNTTKQKSPFTPKSNQGIDETDYTKFTTDTIKAWLEKVRVNIEPDVKNKIIEELTHDVVDRKKYLQVFGSAEPSQSEELEYLKLQVHRRLSEFVPAEAMKVVIVDTKQLLAKIDTVKMKVTPESSKNSKSQKFNNKQEIADILDIGRAKATNTSINGDEEEMEQELSNMEFSPGQTSTPVKPGEENKEPTPEENNEPKAEEYKTKIAESITTWIESVPTDLEPEAKTDFINELANDVIDRNKYLQVQTDKTTSKKEEIENLRFQVFKRLNKVNGDARVTPDIEKVEELYKLIGDGRRKSFSPKQSAELRTALNEEISAILDDYNICCDRKELFPTLANELTKLGKSNADQDEIVENLIETIKRFTDLSTCVCDEEAEELAHKLLYRTKKLIARIQEKDRQNAAGTLVKKEYLKDIMIKDIGDDFNDRSVSEKKRKLVETQLAKENAKDLRISPLEDVTMEGLESKKRRYGMSFNGLTNFIDTWLSSIHTDDDTKGEGEIKDMKKDMAYSLIQKIGEMNVDPEIFNDDSLYEAVLRDELQNLFSDITISDDEIQAIKEDLIEKVLEAQHRAHDEIAGQTYKRNLRDTISKLLPDQRNLSKEEQATMETLKDQLADAYINLHYSGGNENQRELLQRKITDEINNFCRDYLYRNPCTPLTNRTLNNNLYIALNKVPLPAGDSIRYEVEQARIREEIYDWIKELPLPPQNPIELLARNKLVYVLSKKLFDIEVEGNDTDSELMKKAIVKFLKKMPLESRENNDTLADKLIHKLKASEESRKYDASSNVTIEVFGNFSASSSGGGMDSPICPTYKSLATPGSSGSPKLCIRPCPKQPKPLPPCTLSSEDRAQLERIKRRTCLSPSCVSSFIRNKQRDTGVGPRPVDTESQTVLRPFGMEKRHSPIRPVDYEKTLSPCPCPVSANLAYPPSSNARNDSFEIEEPPQSPICHASHEKITRACPAGTSKSSPQYGHQIRRHTISSSNIECPIEEIKPQIVIKQYYWNPNEKNSIFESDLQQSGRNSRRQSDQVSCHQPSPAPCQHTVSASCNQPRPSSYPQSTPAPYHRPSLDKLHHQNTSPHRITRDQAFTCPDSKSEHQPPPDRYSYWEPQRSFQRGIPSSRPLCTPSPVMSPFGLNQQSSPPCSSDFSRKDLGCRMPKRDGLQDEMYCNGRPSQKERVVELGSLEDIRNARPKKRHSDQSDWPYTKFQEDDNFWGVPMRRVILDEGIDESVVMEREQREERIRCKCKERLIPKSGRSQPRTCPSREILQDNEDGRNLKRCSKCCGRHCPYPSFLYFRQ